MSIVIIFLLLYHEFRSVKESGVILLNLPLALIGGVFALVITDRRSKHSGNYRFHFAVRYRDP